MLFCKNHWNLYDPIYCQDWAKVKLCEATNSQKKQTDRLKILGENHHLSVTFEPAVYFMNIKISSNPNLNTTGIKAWRERHSSVGERASDRGRRESAWQRKRERER